MPLATHAAVPALKSGAGDPPIDASRYASLLLIDLASGKTLYKLEPAKSWTPASLTKLMTVETFTSTPTKWDAYGNILKQDEVGGGRLAVPSGARMTFRDLLFSAIVGSANNAAEALGRLDGPGAAAFVAKMNAHAQALGLVNSHFNDASGMNEKNVTTAYDMANLFLAAADDPEVHAAMTAPNYPFTVLASPNLAKNVKNTNLLVTGDPAILVTGGKTGYLVESRYNFALSGKPGAGEPQAAGELLAIVFGASSRDDSQQAAADLLKWGWNAFDWSGSPTFTRNMGQGDRGADAKALQVYLNAHGARIASSGAGSPGHETELFGALTKAALIRFQDAHAADILTPQGKTKGSGYLDLLTREYINGGAQASVTEGTRNEDQGSFHRDLSLGSRGEDVRALQRLLNDKGFTLASSGVGSPGHETDYFGPLTQAALTRFQDAKAAEISVHGHPISGSLGTATRAYLNG